MLKLTLSFFPSFLLRVLQTLVYDRELLSMICVLFQLNFSTVSLRVYRRGVHMNLLALHPFVYSSDIDLYTLFIYLNRSLCTSLSTEKNLRGAAKEISLRHVLPSQCSMSYVWLAIEMYIYIYMYICVSVHVLEVREIFIYILSSLRKKGNPLSVFSSLPSFDTFLCMRLHAGSYISFTWHELCENV